GFWLLLAGFALALADTLARLRIGPLQRLALLLLAGCGLAAMLGSGLWRDLAVLREYASRADIFWVEAGNHIMLAFASLAAAILVGIPLGVLCHRSATIRQPLLNVLNIVQTIP